MIIYLRLVKQKWFPRQKIKDAAVAQSVERRIGSAEVTGPIPVSSWIEETETLVEKVSVSFRKGYAAH